MAGLDPTIARQRLRTQLREVRRAAGRSHKDTAVAMDFSLSKIIRIESGQVGVSTNDLRALVSYYGVAEDDSAGIFEMARIARNESRWDRYRDLVSQDFLTFLGYESSASVIRNFEPTVVPGLLQTKEYARVVLDQGLVGRQDVNTDVDRYLKLRLLRQELLSDDDTPDCQFVVDEAVLARVVGGADVMEGQLSHLRALVQLPHVDLRVVPFWHGLYRYWRLPHILFEFPDPRDERILFAEDPRGALIVREDSAAATAVTVGNYLDAFLELMRITEKQSPLALLDAALARVRAGEPAPETGSAVV